MTNLDLFTGSASIVFGGLIGGAMGYFIKKFLKLILFAMGLLFTVLAFLQYKGWINVVWPKVQSDSESFVNTTSQQILHSVNTTAQHLANNGLGDQTNLIFMMLGTFGFIPGFWMGFLRG
jgi:uncharacterized membrane protein (Fun14 family)